jgi:superfamily II DNA or RNA helicase
MAIIEVNNLYSQVSGLTDKSKRKLIECLAVECPGYEYSSSYQAGTWDGMTHFFNKRSNKFPTGLLVDAYGTLMQNKDGIQVVDKRRKIEYTLSDSIELFHEELGTITLRDYQYKSVEDALKSTRGIVNVATNGGKTEIACGIIKTVLPNLKSTDRIAFFTHSKEIFTQTVRRIQERLHITVGQIGMDKWDVQQVTVVMIPTISKYVSKPSVLPAIKKYREMDTDIQLGIIKHAHMPEGQEKLDLALRIDKLNTEKAKYEKEQWGKIDKKVKDTKKFLNSVVMFIGDEAHHSSSDTWYELFMSLKNAYFRFGLTGTVDEDNEINLRRLYGCTGEIVSKVSNKFLIDNGYSAKPTIYMLPLTKAKVIGGVGYMEARRLGIIENDTRNTVFVNKIVERAKSGKQCLIIVNETEHGEILLSMLKDTGISVELSHGDRSDKFRQEALNGLKVGTLQVLIATSILDEGVDISGINCVFLMAGGKSLRMLLQRIGRGLRKKEDGSGVEVYDCLDYHNEYLVDHLLDRYNTYKSEGFDIQKL